VRGINSARNKRPASPGTPDTPTKKDGSAERSARTPRGSAASPAKKTKDAVCKEKSSSSSPGKAARKEKSKLLPKARLCEPPAVKNFDGWLPVYECGPDAEILPFVSGVPGGWRERWCGVCDDCFQKGQQCHEYPELPLRMLIVGHNPSVKTWEVGVAYGNPSNRFWGLLRSCGILPAQWRPHEALHVINNRMPYELGIGISDLGCLAGSDAAHFGGDIMRIWRDDFYRRVNAHVRRVQVSRGRAVHVQEEKEAGRGGRQGGGESLVKKEAAHEASEDYPVIVAFTGKRHFASLFDPPLKKVDSFGRQPAHLRPPAWPFPVICTPFQNKKRRAAKCERCHLFMKKTNYLTFFFPKTGEQRSVGVAISFWPRCHDNGGARGAIHAARQTLRTTCVARFSKHLPLIQVD
jgi:hypothetical protein